MEIRTLPLDGKPCCLFVVTDPGENAEDCQSIVSNEIKNLGMKLIPYELRLGAHAAGKLRGEVVRDQNGLEDCIKGVRKLIYSISSNI